MENSFQQISKNTKILNMEVIRFLLNNKLSQRKNMRLKYYDYSLEGYYFITICTKHRKEILGKINVGVALLGDPNKKIIKQIDLTREGDIVNKHINNCNKIFNSIFIDEYVIMPNHIHFIIAIQRVAEDCDPYNSKNN